MHGLHVAQVLLYLSFTSHHISYPCALVQWFIIVGDAPCGETGMWIVKPEMEDDILKLGLLFISTPLYEVLT